ncbi:MAG: biotin--[acetyl-CoA-carboxylase] ligase, partial [Crocinitomicaceae bacterium]|nr:biotin--[acetyl-CoA-carboxylase] ligase [Crocinitomicaceae bacterium]
LKQQGIESEIKWPNDVYVNGIKIGGILIENHISGKEIKSSIIGIGLNVNQKDFGAINATSMSLESGKQYILNELYFSFIHVMNGVWEKYWADINLDKRYLNSLYRINVRSSYTDKNGEFEGVITGVSSEGKLRMERGAETIEYTLKEISFR